MKSSPKTIFEKNISDIRLAKRPSRVWLSIIIHSGLAGLLWIVAFAPSIKDGAGQFVLLILGSMVFYQTIRLYQKRNGEIRLLDDRLVDECGQILCMIANIKHIERGIFALKPSHGFLIILKEPMKRGWNVGLWWRIGRHVGIGGLTGRDAGKMMADALSYICAQAENDACK